MHYNIYYLNKSYNIIYSGIILHKYEILNYNELLLLSISNIYTYIHIF